MIFTKAVTETVFRSDIAIPIVSFFACIVVAKRRKSSIWPRIPGGVPLLGNLLSLGGQANMVITMERWADMYGKEKGVYEMNLGGVKYIVACRADTVMEIMKQRPFTIRRNEQLAEAVHSVGADGLFNAEGETWKKDRRLVASSLNKRHVEDYLPTVKRIASRLIEKWREASSEGDTIAIKSDNYCLAIDIIALVAFGKDFDCLRQGHIRDAADVKMTVSTGLFRSLSPIKYWNIPLIGQYIDGGGWAVKRLSRAFHKMVEDHEECKDDPNVSQDTFLAKICNLRGLDNSEMSNQRVVGNLLTMFFGATDSTATTLTTALWQIAKDSTGLQDELADEAMALSDFENSSLDDLLRGLPRTRSFYHELLRVMGPFPFLLLQNTREIKFAGVKVEPNTKFITLNRYAGIHDSADGAQRSSLSKENTTSDLLKNDPSDFKPRRWLVSSGKCSPTVESDVTFSSSGNDVGGSLAFGHGLRICPGIDLGESMALVSIASVLRSLEITLAENHAPVKFAYSWSNGPDVDIKLRLKPRQIVHYEECS